MELSFLLMKTIASMLLMVAVGCVIIKTKIITPVQGKAISTLVLYVVTPCAVISSFQMEYTNDRLTGLLFSVAAVAVIQGLLIGIGTLIRRPLKLTDVEAASIMYPNSVNLIMPLVIYVLGKEWAFYCSGAMIVQTFLIWTHGKSVVCGERQFDFKKVFLNINIIVLFVSIAMFLLRIKLPVVVTNAVDGIGGCLGPLSMLIIGMLLGERGFKTIIKDKTAYLVSFLRLIALPVVIVLLVGITGVEKLHPDGWNIMLIVVMQSSSAVAAVVTQFAQIYDKDGAHAGTINVMSVLFCIITLPLMVGMYQLLT